jgi:sortase A
MQEWSKRSSRVRALEIAAWTLGVVLLATYGGIRAWSSLARADGVAAMQQARAQYGNADFATGPPLATAAPDTSTWAPKRLAAYRDALRDPQRPDAVLRIPNLKLAVPIYDGTSERNLNRGAGRIEGTAHIGATGNVGLAAHRDGFFRPLKDIHVGDPLYIDTVAHTLIYRVTSIRIVTPAQVDVLAPTQKPSLTLVTCYPFYFVGSAPNRFIVRAQLEDAGRRAEPGTTVAAL